MPTNSNGGCVASNLQNPSQPEFRLLLDQGFPGPSGFDPRDVDRTIGVTHLYEFDRTLSETGAPDWAIYCRAVEGGSSALVTRDESQTKQLTEMYVLSRLPRFSIITSHGAEQSRIRFGNGDNSLHTYLK